MFIYLGGGGIAPSLLISGCPGCAPCRHWWRSWACTSRVPDCSDDVGARYRRFCMAENAKSATSGKPESEPSERDEPVKIDLDPEVALRALLKVDPDSDPVKAPSDSQRPKRR